MIQKFLEQYKMLGKKKEILKKFDVLRTTPMEEAKLKYLKLTIRYKKRLMLFYLSKEGNFILLGLPG